MGRTRARKNEHIGKHQLFIFGWSNLHNQSPISLKIVISKLNLINKRFVTILVHSIKKICCLHLLTDGFDLWNSNKNQVSDSIQVLVFLCCLFLGFGFNNENSLVFRQIASDDLQFFQITRARKNEQIDIHKFFLFEWLNLRNQRIYSLF